LAIRRSVILWDTQDGYSCCHLRNANMRRAVVHNQRLSISLRYLATGNNFEGLKFIMVKSELLCWRRVYCSADRL